MGDSNIDKIRNRLDNSHIVPRAIKLLVWVAMVIMWWVIISLTIDMPMEYKLRHSTDDLRSEYGKMSARYDSLTNVLDNVVKRDENVFRKLFESNPYDLSADFDKERIALYEQLVGMDNDELTEMLDKRIQKAVTEESNVLKSYDKLKYNISNGGLSVDYVPAIQPVNNRKLTLLAAGKKPLINPFHRTISEHHGVDYLIPEGTPVFATADGVIKSLSEKNSSHGKAVTISHGNGYETSYSHLLDIRVKKGQKVKRGDIIALSGNSGLSFVPHLHYEVIYNDTRVDPVHYFFLELNPDEYQQIIRIALSSMQSFD
ncbi:MAG: M23 family metallopeptidase [Alistipes sp.]|jgi:murein DD-endopeptidase MepM/ murein hydrolase activator NlpD|nr:M23 family metallopeptidase [Alistipes sp.]